MKILIYGAGAVGSAFGGFLSKEHEVTLLGRRTEIGAINGAIVRLGKKLKVPAPVNRMLAVMIKEKEKQRR